MAFVNELISDQDKLRFDWEKFKWSQYRPGHRPWKWTIDRDRNAFLVMLVARGREGEHPEMYALWWEGELIQFSADIHSKGTFSTGADLYWKVFDIEMKASLYDQKNAIQNLLREAIEAFGNVYDRSGVKSVNVTFVPRLASTIPDDSMPNKGLELSHPQLRYKKTSLLANYEFPQPKRVFFPIVSGVVMITVFVLWMYLYLRGSISFGDLLSGRYQRGRGPLLVMFIWLFFFSMLLGGLYSLRLAWRNWTASRSE